MSPSTLGCFHVKCYYFTLIVPGPENSMQIRSIPWMSAEQKQLSWSLTHWGREKKGGLYPDDIFKCIFLTENVIISITISLQFVPKGSINNIPTMVQIRLSMHTCVTRPQWVNCFECCYNLPKTITMSVLFGPGGLYVRLWTGSGFVKLLDWRIFVAKPFFKPLQTLSKRVRKGAPFTKELFWQIHTPGYQWTFLLDRSVK